MGNYSDHFGEFNDATLGSCYTFNHLNSSQNFKAVVAGEKGGQPIMVHDDERW